MAFFKTNNIAEFQACVPVSVDFSLNRVMNSILSIGLRWVKPAIGATLYNDLDTKYNANTLSPTELTAVKLIQMTIANLVIGQDLPLLGSVIDDAGVYMNKSAEKWVLGDAQLAKAEDRYWERGIDGLEDLVSFLNENASSSVLVGYYNSIQQGLTKELLVGTAEVFGVYYQIWRNALTFWALKAHLLSVQRGIIANTLADAFTSVVTPGNDVKKLKLLGMVQEAMVYLSMAQGLKLRKIKISRDAVTVLMEQYEVRAMQTPALNDILVAARSFEEMGLAKLMQIEDYLVMNAADLGYTIVEVVESGSINKKENGLYMC
ncbi:DUF6712 family protein [Emticicia sp.]|uniref:DUF6712 family protein n=1 Tax=Emticicia sp. TaxID=1930953 RepID=UPI0037503755